ncbi:MAG: LysM peptidoglycan-binding domain-containing protein, partial [Pseudomonadota bacterium]
EDGSWRTSLPEVDAGIYTLRVDEVSVSGTVTSRVETPFRREAPAVVAEVVAESRETPAETGPIDEGVITVQPGATLWAIAREQYGDGVLYVKVFEANSDRIRDPNLIYPGQIFDLPD